MINVDLDGPVARITLSNPQKHNALTRDAMADLSAAFDRIEAEPDCRAIILTGQGRSFCAGAALGEVAGEDWSENPLTALCDRIEQTDIPTICALNGGVYGGGVELALACDFRIGVEGMRAFVPPARLGIHYEPAGMARALRVLGLQTTRHMFLRAAEFDAGALLESGFLDELVAGDDLTDAAERFAGEIAALAPLAVQGMKRSLREISANSLDAEAARKRIACAFASDDHREGLAAQKERRAPVFKGS